MNWPWQVQFLPKILNSHLELGVRVHQLMEDRNALKSRPWSSNRRQPDSCRSVRRWVQHQGRGGAGCRRSCSAAVAAAGAAASDGGADVPAWAAFAGTGGPGKKGRRRGPREGRGRGKGPNRWEAGTRIPCEWEANCRASPLRGRLGLERRSRRNKWAGQRGKTPPIQSAGKAPWAAAAEVATVEAAVAASAAVATAAAPWLARRWACICCRRRPCCRCGLDASLAGVC